MVFDRIAPHPIADVQAGAGVPEEDFYMVEPR